MGAAAQVGQTVHEDVGHLLAGELDGAYIQFVALFVREQVVFDAVDGGVGIAVDGAVEGHEQREAAAGAGQAHAVARLCQQVGLQQHGLVAPLAEELLACASQQLQVAPVGEVHSLALREAVVQQAVVLLRREALPGIRDILLVDRRQTEAQALGGGVEVAQGAVEGHLHGGRGGCRRQHGGRHHLGLRQGVGGRQLVHRRLRRPWRSGFLWFGHGGLHAHALPCALHSGGVLLVGFPAEGGLLLLGLAAGLVVLLPCLPLPLAEPLLHLLPLPFESIRIHLRRGHRGQHQEEE